MQLHSHSGVAVKGPRLLTEERRREIVGLLDQQGRITVDEVRRKFNVSAVTARGDLDALSATGMLIRSHGGGIKPLDSGPDYPLKDRENINHDQKVRIAKAAVDLIRPYQTVILCTGSTSAEVASQLRRVSPENVAVITYALNIAVKLADAPNLSLIMIGGILRQVSNAFVGPQAEAMMESLHADHLFLSAVGVHPDVGPSTIDILEAQLNSKMVRAAREVTVIADGSKLGQLSLAVITQMENVHRLICDTDAPAATLAQCEARGVKVMLV
jgi:DeoR family transcriptional regulator, aga operon transcriptional repressor